MKQKNVFEMLREHQGALTIQRHHRGHVQRTRVTLQLAERRLAAAMVQQRYRAMQTRRSEAATVLQRMQVKRDAREAPHATV